MRLAVVVRSLFVSHFGMRVLAVTPGITGIVGKVSTHSVRLRLLSRAADIASIRGHNNQAAIGRSDLTALFINVRERPQRRTFAEAQYRALGLKAQRIEGSGHPTRLLGLDRAWIQAASECANMTGSERFCLIAEDDAVYRPLDKVEAEHIDEQRTAEDDAVDPPVDKAEAERVDEQRRPMRGQANPSAEPARFFSALAAAVANLPGGVDGPWTGLHLCTLGQRSSLTYAEEGSRVQGGPWPQERFSSHALYPGAPGVLLLRHSQARFYAEKLQARLDLTLANHMETPSDVLQSQLYSTEDAAAARGVSGTLQVFVADNPQLCQHLTDLSNDPALRSSMENESPSARSAKS